MVPIRVREVLEATDGTLLCGDIESVITDVVTDSRSAKEGTLFVPVIGERVDAHRFIPDVMAAGAAASFTSDPDIMAGMADGMARESGESAESADGVPEKAAGSANGVPEEAAGNVSDGFACIYVRDTIEALQKLAAAYRAKFDIPVIGVTGSVGKTTTKEMISAVLSRKYHVLKTIGNLNSQIGTALMMFHIDEQTELGVFEMGISLPGEMARLVEIVKPQTAVMTNIGVSHIGNLGSREAITYEKGHIIKYVGTEEAPGRLGGRMYVCGNGDLRQLSKENLPWKIVSAVTDGTDPGAEKQNEKQTPREEISAGDIVYYGTEPDCDRRADGIQVTERGQRFVYHGQGSCEVELSVMGAHNVNNAVIALALAEQFGVDLTAAAAALAEYRPFSMRGERKDCHGYHIIDDTYNASPDSINSNIDALFDYGEDGRKIAVLGDVLELGEQREELHRGIGTFILKEAAEGKKLSYVVTVGEGAGFIAEQVREHSDIPTEKCASTEEAAAWIREMARPGDWILVKGSRGMHMDEVVEKVVMSCTQM